MARETVDLCGTWRFQPDLFRQGEKAGYTSAALDSSGWPEAKVPCSLDDCLPGLASYEGCGWFTRRVAIPRTWSGRHVVLRFEGVNYKANVWVNGQHVGQHPDGFLRFDLDVTGVIHCGDDNAIVVKVDNARVDGEVPGLCRGWKPSGGILREVYLCATDQVRITRVATTAGHDGTFRQAVSVANGRTAPVTVSVETRIVGSDGAEVACLVADPVALEAGETRSVALRAQVEGIEQWSPRSPVLYEARVLASVDGAEVDSETLRVGFRSVGTDGAVLLLNGEPIVLRGFNRHEDSPLTGMCTDLDTTRSDLETMKRIGCNFVRLCHYPHHPAELDMCDELGLLVMCEIPLWGWGYPKADKPAEFDNTLAAAKRQLIAMIRRDGNHPSVVFWSVSNETNEGIDDVTGLNDALLSVARKEDPTRLAVHVSNHWRQHPHFEQDAVVCVNDYPTWWQASCGDWPLDIPRAAGIWRESLEELHTRYPDKPILVTEFGGFSLEGVNGISGGEDVHAETIETEFSGMQAPYVCGTTIWCWADHPWPEEGWMGRVRISPFGVVSRKRAQLAPFRAAARIFSTRPDR